MAHVGIQGNSIMPTPKLHQRFVATLKDLADSAAVAYMARFFHADPNGHSGGNKFLGVRHGKVFSAAKRFIEMPVDELERLLVSPYYEVRLGAVSIMDFQARTKRTPADQRKGRQARRWRIARR